MSSWQTAFRHLTLFHCFWRLRLLSMAIQGKRAAGHHQPRKASPRGERGEGGGAKPLGGGGHQKAKGRGGIQQAEGRGGVGVGGGGSSRQRQTPAQGQEPNRHERARDHERQGDDTRETKTRGGAPHALGRPARPTQPGQRGGAPHELRRPAPPSRPGKHHRPRTPDNAACTAAQTTAHQQN